MPTDQQRTQACVAALATTADLYTGILSVHHIPSQSVVYMSRRGLELLGITLAELRALGADYHQRFFNPEDATEYAPKIWALVAQNDFERETSFFQQVRTQASPDWSLYLSSVRLLLRDAAGQPLLLLSHSCAIDPASHVPLKVQRLVEENNFLRQHAPRFAAPTAREREVLRLLCWATRPRKSRSSCLSRRRRPKPTAATSARSSAPNRLSRSASSRGPST